MGELKLKQHQNKLLIIAIILSIISLPGIPMIIFGAINHLWVLMSFGILFVACSFYGCPLSWTFYAEDKRMHKYICLIKSGCYSIDRLAFEFKAPKSAVKNTVKKIIDKRYLLGYSFPNEKMLIEHKPRVSYEKCPECGAGVNVIGWTSVCPYCNAVVQNTHPYKEYKIEVCPDRFNLIKTEKQKILVKASLPNYQEIEVSDTIIVANNSTNETIKASLTELLMASSVKKIIKQHPLVDFGYEKLNSKQIYADILSTDVTYVDENKYGVMGFVLEIKKS